MFKRNCPKCNSHIIYSSRSNWNRGNKTNSLCYGCTNETRMGRKRTDEQKQKISESTKKAMSNPATKEKFLSTFTDERRKLKSESTKQQMKVLKENKIAFNNFKKLQSNLKKEYWNSVDDETKQLHLNNLEIGRIKLKRLWNTKDFHSYMCSMRTKEKNGFYGKHHSPETIEKLREATTNRLLRFWSEGGLHGINTKPELLVQKLLKKNNIEFITPFVLENKIFDLYIPKYNLIIEIDGCYWHSKNIKVENMEKQQLRRWKNDQFKNNLVKKNDMKLIRIWEDEIDETTLTERIYNI